LKPRVAKHNAGHEARIALELLRDAGSCVKRGSVQIECDGGIDRRLALSVANARALLDRKRDNDPPHMERPPEGEGIAIVWTVIFDYHFDHRRFDVPLGGLLEWESGPTTNQRRTEFRHS
jgi:hypothetical protein